MKLTKYQHACVVVEHDNTTLVIDPGVFTKDFIMPHRVDAIIITHEHTDHFDEALVAKILATHPKATLFSHEAITGQFTNYTTIAAKLGEPYTIGSTTLQFYGGQHAAIAPSIQTPPNFGVLVNKSFYYPGDSFTIPTNIPVETLALPVSAPWLKMSEPMEFLAQIKPSLVFPTHDAILSSVGKQLADRMIGAVASGINATYKRLDSTTVEIS